MTQKGRAGCSGTAKFVVTFNGPSCRTTMLSGTTWRIFAGRPCGYCTSSSLNRCTSGRRGLTSSKLARVIFRWSACGVASMKCSSGRLRRYAWASLSYSRSISARGFGILDLLETLVRRDVTATDASPTTLTYASAPFRVTITSVAPAPRQRSQRMAIDTSCPHCRTAYTLPDEQRGKKVRCKHCEETFSVLADDDIPILEEATADDRD